MPKFAAKKIIAYSEKEPKRPFIEDNSLQIEIPELSEVVSLGKNANVKQLYKRFKDLDFLEEKNLSESIDNIEPIEAEFNLMKSLARHLKAAYQTITSREDR